MFLRVLERNFKKGFVKVVPRTLDDLWHLYNIIYKGDLIYGRTTRELKMNIDYSRPQKGKRVSVFLSIKVEDVVWDRSLNRLRVHGKIHEAPENVAGRGSHHTLNVMVSKPITIVKEKWSKHQIDRLKRAAASEVRPIIVVSIDSEEYCIALIRQYGVDVQAASFAKLPGKLEAEKRTNALKKYFGRTLDAVREVWRRNHYAVVIIGVGLTKNQFLNYIRSEAPDLFQSILDFKSVNSSGLAGIEEALRSGVLNKALKHLRIAEETKSVEEVLARLGKGTGNVTYGLEQVEKANMLGAVETFLVADFTIRDSSDERRLVLEKLMTDVEGKGGNVSVISAEHEAGQKLLALGGVAALLRFPIS